MTAGQSSHDITTVPLALAAPGQRDHSVGPRRRVSLLLYHRDRVEVVLLRPGVGVVVGREPPADIVVQESSLSRRHACFTLLDGQVFVEDLSSLNGTRLGDQRITRSVAPPGEKVTLGAMTALVHVHTDEDGFHGLESHDLFRAALQAEVVRARYFGRALAVLTVQAARDEERHVSRWCPRLQELLRPVDRVALYSADAVDILLPEVSSEQALEIARRIAACMDGQPPLWCGLAAYPGAATTAEQLLERARGALHAASRGEPVQAAAEGARVWVSAAGSPGEGKDDEDGPVAASPAMRALFETAARLGRLVIPILLYGETGTGKEVLAKLVHDAGPRRANPVVCVNCGAIPADLRESILFGHIKGAFTGAASDRAGVFESAHGGTVLLDEIGELSPAAQTALLRVLETKRVTRVGSNKEVEADVRIIAATHRDLSAMCEAGTFRQDLFYRLDAMTLTVPPLRERREDIGPLAARFLRRANQLNGCEVEGLDAEALLLLEAYAWPGNVRELRNAVERAVVIARGCVVTVEDLPDRVRSAGRDVVSSEPDAPDRESPVPVAPRREEGSPQEAYGAQMVRLEAAMLVEALRDAGWNQTQAARRLKMPLRTLQHKIKVLGLKKLGQAE
jgi:DNA-binding NtrC family response regulator